MFRYFIPLSDQDFFVLLLLTFYFFCFLSRIVLFYELCHLIIKISLFYFPEIFIIKFHNAIMFSFKT